MQDPELGPSTQASPPFQDQQVTSKIPFSDVKCIEYVNSFFRARLGDVYIKIFITFIFL